MTLAKLPLDPDLVAFFDARTPFESAWAKCPRPDWQVALALHAGVDRRLLVLLSASVVERALERHSLLTDTARLARGWARGEVSGAECWAAGFRAVHKAKAMSGMVASAQRAASALAFACDERSDGAYYAMRGHLVDAVALCLDSIGPDDASSFASVFRQRIDGVEVARATAARVAHSQPPPPRPTGEHSRRPHSWRPPAPKAVSGEED